ncbi:MAG: TIGR01212 family radical SAM protein [Clostridiales bacterium]|nr:TIGR01212 family radical SAM protein [Clostridiales bacterium]MCF8022969.1 TIGR01212 family radical SAM protein [Clostridiales bacterium]
MERYNTYSQHLKNKFGQKVYKLPINLPGTCPNRDGTISTGGCIFCDEQGSGFDALPNTMAVKEQISNNKTFFANRFKAKKFIAYFQAFTNTYVSLDKFKENMRAAAEEDDIVGISVSTRPDCISDPYLDFLASLQNEYNLDINIELGLQTANYHTLVKVNRGHTLAEFIDAVNRIKKRGFEICTHLILNLPWDKMLDAVECAKLVSALEIEYVKLHSLYVVNNTIMGDMYQKGEITIVSLQEYASRVVNFLEHLHPDIVIQRLAGKGPADKVLFSNWNLSWWQVKQEIENLMESRNTYQGKYCTLPAKQQPAYLKPQS